MTVPILPGATSTRARLLDMAPRLAVDDLPNGAQVDSKLKADGLHRDRPRAVESADGADLGVIEYRGGAFFPDPAATKGWASSLAILGVPIRRVVGVGSKPKMSRVAARRIVTRMADNQPGGDGSIRELPCNPVGAARLPAIPTKMTVPARCAVFHPRPTSVWASLPIHPGPKAGGYGIMSVKHRKLHSGGPLGVCRAARGNVYSPNYTTKRGAK